MAESQLNHPNPGEPVDLSLQSVASTSAPSAMAPSSAPPVVNSFDTFTCFPRLPPEMRLAIWSHTAEPRTIVAEKGLIVLGELNELKYYMRSKPPAGLHVSKESRAELLKSYQLWLSTRELAHGTQGVYVNPWMDTLFIRENLQFSFLWKEDSYMMNYFPIATPSFPVTETLQIKSMAFDSCFFPSWAEVEHQVPQEIMENVEDITLVLHTRECGRKPSPMPRYLDYYEITHKWLAEHITRNLRSSQARPKSSVYEKLIAARKQVRYCDGRMLNSIEAVAEGIVEAKKIGVKSDNASLNKDAPAFGSRMDFKEPGDKIDTCQPFCRASRRVGYSFSSVSK